MPSATVKEREEAITEEAKVKDRSYQDTLKQLRDAEKSQAKASKDVRKAAKAVKKMEHKKQDTVNALRKATDIHDQAVFNFHNAQSDLQAKEQNVEWLSQEVDRLRSRADELSEEKPARDTAREQRLSELHGEPSGSI